MTVVSYETHDPKTNQIKKKLYYLRFTITLATPRLLYFVLRTLPSQWCLFGEIYDLIFTLKLCVILLRLKLELLLVR